MEIVNISNLPLHIQKKLPLSIRTHKDEYIINELPSQIQFIIKDYLEREKNISYGTVYDITPDISEYGDFDTIDQVQNTVLEYLKNYFLTLPNDYPFEPNFGSTLKRHLQTRDTSLRRTLVSAEIDSIVTVITADLGVDVIINFVDIQNLDKGDRIEYVVIIDLTINKNKAKIQFTA